MRFLTRLSCKQWSGWTQKLENEPGVWCQRLSWKSVSETREGMPATTHWSRTVEPGGSHSQFFPILFPHASPCIRVNPSSLLEPALLISQARVHFALCQLIRPEKEDRIWHVPPILPPPEPTPPTLPSLLPYHTLLSSLLHCPEGGDCLVQHVKLLSGWRVF